MIRNENYINIQGWMINKLNLKGNDLICYSLIYGFTQDGEQWFEGSRQYIADWCNSTKTGIQKNLKSLVDKKYLIKEDFTINNVKFCKYKVNLDLLKDDDNQEEYNQDTPSKQSLPPQITKLSTPSKQSLPNTIDNNINNNNKKESKKSFDEIIDEYTENEELRKELKEHLKTRKLKKSALTNRALNISLKDLSEFGKTDEEKIRIVQNSIVGGYPAFYELKKNKNKNDKETSYNINEYEKWDMFE